MIHLLGNLHIQSGVGIRKDDILDASLQILRPPHILLLHDRQNALALGQECLAWRSFSEASLEAGRKSLDSYGSVIGLVVRAPDEHTARHALCFSVMTGDYLGYFSHLLLQILPSDMIYVISEVLSLG